MFLSLATKLRWYEDKNVNKTRNKILKIEINKISLLRLVVYGEETRGDERDS